MLIDAAVWFSLAAALCFTCADFFARRGLAGTDAFVGASITLAGELLFFGLIALFAGVSFPPWGASYLWVAAGGAGNPGLFLVFFMIGIIRVGVARASPIKGSSPLVGALLAIPLLGERPGWVHLAGVACVVGGIALLTSGKTEGRWRRVDALWPVAAAVAAGISAIGWRRGLRDFPDALGGAFVGVAAALLVVGGTTFVRLRRAGAWRGDSGVAGRGWPVFLFCGAAAGAGILLYASALKRGEVYRVLPLVQTSPLFTVLFAALFLRRTEFITWRVPAGALLTVGGAVLVTIRLAGG